MNEVRKLKVYLDTSVISYLDQQDAPEKMQETREVWKLIKSSKYDVYISDVVIKELYDCKRDKQQRLFTYLSEISYNLIDIDESVLRLAKKFIDNGIIKQKSFDDCQHIAAAIISDCDIIVSWNFKHIVNVKTIRGIKAITTLTGYKDILIYPPSALLSEEE